MSDCLEAGSFGSGDKVRLEQWPWEDTAAVPSLFGVLSMATREIQYFSMKLSFQTLRRYKKCGAGVSIFSYLFPDEEGHCQRAVHLSPLKKGYAGPLAGEF